MNVHAIDIYSDTRSAPVSLALDLFGPVGEPSFLSRLTDSLSNVLKFAHIGVLCFQAAKPPALLGTASTLSPEIALSTAGIYLGGHYNADPTTVIRTRDTGARPTLYMQQQRVKDITDTNYRASCYENTGIVERISLLQHFDSEVWIAVNVYRDWTQGYFGRTDCSRLAAVAPVLIAAANKHRQLTHTCTPITLSRPVAESANPAIHERITALCSSLSARQLQVASLMLAGLTAKEIAKDLGIAPTSVVEHRKSVYTKLAVHDHRQFFALLAAQPA